MCQCIAELSKRRFTQTFAAASLATLLLLTVIRLDAAEQPLDFDELFAQPGLTGFVPSAPEWSPDGRYLAFTWNRHDANHRDLWVASRDGTGLRSLAVEGGNTDDVAAFAWLPDSSGLLALKSGKLWSVGADSDEPRLLGDLGRGASTLSVSPRGRMAAYLKDGDLWLFDIGEAVARRMTSVGIAGVSSLPAGRYSRPEREIGPGIWGGPSYAWSPDGDRIAVHYVDRRDMRKVPFPDYLAEETDPNEVRRGYPGDANERRSAGLLDVATGDLRLLELGDPSSTQIVDFSWSAGGELLVDLASDTAIDRSLQVVQPDSAESREIWRSRRPERIYTSFASFWHPDGMRVLFLSDIADRYGLYEIDTADANARPKRITDAAYDVLDPPATVTPAGTIFYSANGTGPAERHVYRQAANGGSARRITTMAGHHSPYPSPDGEYVAYIHSDDVTPPELYIAAADGSVARRVTRSPSPAFSERSWVRGRYVDFPSITDDRRLHARILEPDGLDPAGKHPVLFGPMYSNTVRNRWAGIYSLIQQYLVQQGYIVVQVDVRGSTGYGRDFREQFLTDFAGGDIDDIESAARYLKSLPYVDSDRLGIWGSSYGGTLTVYTLLQKPGLFRAGVAAAAAVDPRFFGTDDVAIVRRPDSHPEIFLHKAERYAENLEDHLLFIHGMQDQVVPFKTTAALADALIRHGKDFDFVFAPGATHAWSREPPYARFLFGKLVEHFDRYLMN